MVLRKAAVKLDIKAFDGYLGTQNWNGWAIPFFTKETADKIVDYVSNELNKNVADIDKERIIYDESKDSYVLTDSSGEIIDEYDGFDMETTDGMKHLYPVGGCNWIWSAD